MRLRYQRALIAAAAAALILAAPAWLHAGLFGFDDVHDKEDRVMESLYDLADFVEDAWFFRYGRYTNRLEEVERALRDLSEEPKKNMSFWVSSLTAFRYYKAAQTAWRQAERSENGRRYNLSLRDGYFIRAENELLRAASFR